MPSSDPEEREKPGWRRRARIVEYCVIAVLVVAPPIYGLIATIIRWLLS